MQKGKNCKKNIFHGLVRELNPGPLAPEARIIPLDQRAIGNRRLKLKLFLKLNFFIGNFIISTRLFQFASLH